MKKIKKLLKWIKKKANLMLNLCMGVNNSTISSLKNPLKTVTTVVATNQFYPKIYNHNNCNNKITQEKQLKLVVLTL